MTTGVPAVAIVNTFVDIITTLRTAVGLAVVTTRRAAVVMGLVTTRTAAVVMVVVTTRRDAVVMAVVTTRRATVVMVVVTTRRAVGTECGGIFTQWRRRLRRSNQVAATVKIRLTKESFGHKIFIGFSSSSKFDIKRRFKKLCIFIQA